MWTTNGIIQDAGGAAGGKAGTGLSELGITNTGLPLCINSAPTTGPYYRLCFGANVLNQGAITYDALGGATQQQLSCIINGTAYSCVNTGNGNILGPSSPPTVVNDAVTFNNTSGTLVKDAGAPPVLQVPTNTALKALAGASGMTVYRSGFSAAGDGGGMNYTFTAGACSLNGGLGDNGSQVKETNGNCWTWIPVGTRVTPLVFGAAGNGSTDDTTASQSAITAVALAGVPLFMDDGFHSYLISSSLINAPGTVSLDLEGTNGSLGNFSASGNRACHSGLVTNSNITLLVLEGITGKVRNICFQGSATPGIRVSGAAISFGATTGNLQSGWMIEGNSIFYFYEGIIGGSSSTQLNSTQTTIHNNTILDSTHANMVFGRNTTGDNTSGLSLYNNTIGCSSTTGAAAYGIIFYDGDVDYDGTNNGPGDCFIGTAIIPLSGQNFGGHFRGVLGDSSGTHATGGTPHDLEIVPASGGIASNLTFTGAWASGGVIPNGDVPIYISNPSGQSTALCNNIQFVNQQSRTAGTTKIVDYEGGCAQLGFVGGNYCAWNNGTVTDGIYLHPLNVGIEGNYRIVGNHIGFCDTTGATVTNLIHIVQNGTAMQLVVDGNDLSDSTLPIVYVPGDENAIFTGNGGLNNIQASASITFTGGGTTTLPGAWDIYNFTSSGNLNGVTSPWFNRVWTMYNSSGGNIVFKTGASYGACTADDTVATGTIHRYQWNNANTCWWHVQ